jgi:hypothetical protein
MAGNGRKKVSVQYRKLDDVTGGFGACTLQSALSTCLNQKSEESTMADSVVSRQYEHDKAYGTIVLNYVLEEKPFFFGEIVRYEPGADLPLLQIGTHVKAYNLTQAKAPHGHEPIRGILYFMAIGNHVLILESDVSASRAELYLSWLLGQATSSIAKGTHVMLAAELSAQAGGAQLSQVEEVVFKPRPVTSAEPILESAPVTVGATSRDVSETNTLEVLRAAGMDDTDIQRLCQADTQIEVTLQIKFKGQRRRKQLGIDDANRLLRNVPEDQITLIGPGGRQKEGRILKLAYPANVETVGSLLHTKDVTRALHEAYKYFVSNGFIDG